MLIQNIAECFRLTSSCESYPKYQQKSKNNDNTKLYNVNLFKNPETRVPILTLRDYYTSTQLENHLRIFPDSENLYESPEIVNLLEKSFKSSF